MQLSKSFGTQTNVQQLPLAAITVAKRTLRSFAFQNFNNAKILSIHTNFGAFALRTRSGAHT
jgi:hypothetical protein